MKPQATAWFLCFDSCFQTDSTWSHLMTALDHKAAEQLSIWCHLCVTITVHCSCSMGFFGFYNNQWGRCAQIIIFLVASYYRGRLTWRVNLQKQIYAIFGGKKAETFNLLLTTVSSCLRPVKLHCPCCAQHKEWMSKPDQSQRANKHAACIHWDLILLVINICWWVKVTVLLFIVVIIRTNILNLQYPPQPPGSNRAKGHQWLDRCSHVCFKAWAEKPRYEREHNPWWTWIQS